MYGIVIPPSKQPIGLTSGQQMAGSKFNDNTKVNNSDGPLSSGYPLRLQQNSARRALAKWRVGPTRATGHESLSDKAHLHPPISGLQQSRKSNTSLPADGAETNNVNIDKISTMTLAEFKSMLSSSLSVPQEQTQGYTEIPQGRSSEQPQGMFLNASDPCNRNVLHQKESPVSDSAFSDAYSARQTVGLGATANEDSVFWIHRPKILQRNTQGLNTADILGPKTSTSLVKSKMTKPSVEMEGSTSREEYEMAPRKPASQIKREAVAKVAGAISNCAESPNVVSSSDATSCRPKTPTRPRTLVGAHSSFHQNLLQEVDEMDLLNTAERATSPLMHSLANASTERAITPSRIPKPSFISHPKTPSFFTHESPGEAGIQPSSTSNLSRLNIALANRPAALSRSNSNSSSVKSVDETPISPASSFGEEKMFPVHSRVRRLSNSSDGFNASNTTALSGLINSSGRSYKDIYVAKKAATDGRVPQTRAVTPGPREKWTLGGSSGSILASDSQIPAASTHRRRSISTLGKTDCQSLAKSAVLSSPICQTSGASNIEVEQLMTITNEITFSDDEEINEIIKNAALRVKKQTLRSSSVGARKYVQHHAKQNEEDKIQNTKDKLINNPASKYKIVRRPSSRGSSNGRASPVNVVSRFSQASGSSAHQQKAQQFLRNKNADGADSFISSSQSTHKNGNRTEAWVGTTITDDNKKPLPLPKPVKAGTLAAQELVPRPLEQIQAILSEPKNGYINVDTRSLEPPADPAMFRKMEKLFEKYREMELKASLNQVLASGELQAAAKGKFADTLSTKSDSHRLVSKSSMCVVPLKISSGSAVPAPRLLSGRNPNSPNSDRTSSREINQFTVPASTTEPFQTLHHQSSTSNSPLLESSYQQSKHYFNLDSSNQTQKSKLPDPESDDCGLGVLQDIDPELANNPAALIAKIKEILKVRPRKDENSKVPTRIPAPATLNRRNRSKSVSNLYSDCRFEVNSDSGHDLNESQPGGNSVFHNSESQPGGNSVLHNSESQAGGNSILHMTKLQLCSDDARSFKKPSNLVSENVNATSSVDYSANIAPDLMPIAVNFDSYDNQNRSETPVPKMATPLTTGRSTLISLKGDKFARNIFQDKENVSTSQSTISALSVVTSPEDQVEFV